MITIMSDLIDALAHLLGNDASAAAGSVLFHQGDEVRHLYVVRTGCVHLVRYSEAGALAVMQRATAGAVLAESSVFSSHYHCDALVVSDASLARAEIGKLKATLRDNPALLEAITRHLAREVQRTRSRLELLGRRTVEERLDGWLALNGGPMPGRGIWRSVAEEIGVSPEALYRELKRRRSALRS
jgi:CRP/FNR family transcriptional regulator, dissimilatory nitrate respiration regulator